MVSVLCSDLSPGCCCLSCLALLHPSQSQPDTLRVLLLSPSWPHTEPSQATSPHWLAARPRDGRQTAGIFANSYWQLVRRRPEILQTFYTESRRMKFWEIDQCSVTSYSKFRTEATKCFPLRVRLLRRQDHTLHIAICKVSL